MATFKNSTALSTSLAEMTKLGETAGKSNLALFGAVKYFSNLVAKTDGLAATDETCAEYGNAFADGQEKGSGDTISEGSRKQYRDQMKLWADPKVNAVIPTIEKETNAFVKKTSLKDRGDRRFFALAKAAASRIKKGKVEKITPELFADICKVSTAADGGTSEEKAKKAAKNARTAFIAACKALHEAGLLDKPEHRFDLALAATAFGVELKFDDKPVPVVPETPEHMADLNAVIAAAVAAALANLKS